MRKLSTIVETSLAGLAGILEFRPVSEKSKYPGSSTKSITSDKEPGFRSFVLGEKQNRKYLVIALAGTVIQFVLLKILYPFPDFISDSYSYIATNVYHMDVNLWPIGYSKFLFWVHMISHSDSLLVGIQYFLLQASLAYFFFSLLYLYRPARNTVIIIYIFLFFNPLFLYLSNAVLSDSLFTALTIVFLSQFLWMFHRPTLTQVIIQGVIVGICFTIRYTAIYYPLVALAGLLLSKHRPIIKLAGFFLGIALMIPFYISTTQKTKKITGTAEFSVFGGWQIANNALYMYNHIYIDTNKLPPETRELDRWSKVFFKKVNPSTQQLADLPGTYFIKVPYAILKPYLADRYSYDTPPDQFHAWGMVSPTYKKYGTYLISHFPMAFAQYYLWLNTKNYFQPHLEKFDSYNLQINTVPGHVQQWFDYTTPEVHSISATLPGKIFYFYSSFFMALNIIFGASLIWLVVSKRSRYLSPYFKKVVLFLCAFLTINFAFSIFATPVVLRYQIIPIILLFSFSLLLMEFPNKLKTQSAK